jgi:mannose-1-phosphate guanylyltransferase
MIYAVIMAGGIGSRFWPASRRARPKQFLNVFGEATLIQNTLGRLQGLIPPERCLIVTNEDYVEQTQDQLPVLPAENILAEPLSRNTAPCITYAAVKLLARDPDATMVVLPADHIIHNVKQFHAVLRTAIEKAQEPGSLVTIGINPTHPATGYGYIQFDGSTEDAFETPRAFPVRTFAEKPDLATAERFLDSGDFLWNSGMFIWRADTILDEVERQLPKTYEAFLPLQAAAGTDGEHDAVVDAFEKSQKISIDYGVMEEARHVYVVPGSFGWSDVGDWRAVYDLSEQDQQGNALSDNVIAYKSSRCLVYDSGRLVALVGVRDTVVVDTGDAVLVCNLDSSQQVKHVVNYLETQQLEGYL